MAGINFALDVRNDRPAAPSGLRVVTSAGTAQFAWNAPGLFNAGAPTSYLLEAGLSPGTTLFTRPHSSAVLASYCSQKNQISRARFSPTVRAR